MFSKPKVFANAKRGGRGRENPVETVFCARPSYTREKYYVSLFFLTVLVLLYFCYVLLCFCYVLLFFAMFLLCLAGALRGRLAATATDIADEHRQLPISAAGDSFLEELRVHVLGPKKGLIENSLFK